MFAAAEEPSSKHLRQLLALAIRTELVGSRSAPALEAGLVPVPPLSADTWLPALNDNSVEFHVALALTAARDRRPIPRQPSRAEAARSIAELLRPITRLRRGSSYTYDWATDEVLIAAVDGRSVAELLVDVAVLRSRVTTVHPGNPADEAPFVGCRPQFIGQWRCHRSDVEAFATGTLDESRLRSWLDALMAIGDLRGPPSAIVPASNTLGTPSAVAPLWRLLAPLFESQALDLVIPDPDSLRSGSPLVDATLRPAVPSTWPARLRAGHAREIIEELPSRLALAGARPVMARGRQSLPVRHSTHEARAALAASMVPVRKADLAALLGGRLRGLEHLNGSDPASEHDPTSEVDPLTQPDPIGD